MNFENAKLSALQYDMGRRSDYTKQLLSNLDTTPKTIFDLMENHDTGWDSGPACYELLRLVEVGIAKYSSKGSRFQDHYFVINDTTIVDDSFYQNVEEIITYKETVKQILSFTKEI